MGLVLPFTPLCLTFRNINYYVAMPKVPTSPTLPFVIPPLTELDSAYCCKWSAGQLGQPVADVVVKREAERNGNSARQES